MASGRPDSVALSSQARAVASSGGCSCASRSPRSAMAPVSPAAAARSHKPRAAARSGGSDLASTLPRLFMSARRLRVPRRSSVGLQRPPPGDRPTAFARRRGPGFDRRASRTQRPRRRRRPRAGRRRRAQRPSDVVRGQLGGRDLVQQRLKLVVVVAVDERDRHAFLAKGSRAGDAGGAAAEYHHVRCQGLLLGLVPRPHRRRLVSILTGHTNSILRSTSVGNADQQGWD